MKHRQFKPVDHCPLHVLNRSLPIMVLFIVWLSSVSASEPYFGPNTYHWRHTAGSGCALSWWPGDCARIESSDQPSSGYLYHAPRTLSHWMNTHELTLEFESPDYFDANLTGHWAIAVRADGISDATGNGSPDLQGRGLVIGNVSGLEAQGICGPTRQIHSIAMEAFWAGGNCVYGPSTEGPALENDIRYRLQLVSSAWLLPMMTVVIKNRYRLWRLDAPGRWIEIGSDHYLEGLHGPEPANNPAAAGLGNFFITEVFSQHDWQMSMDQVMLYECGPFQPQCSTL